MPGLLNMWRAMSRQDSFDSATLKYFEAFKLSTLRGEDSLRKEWARRLWNTCLLGPYSLSTSRIKIYGLQDTRQEFDRWRPTWRTVRLESGLLFKPSPVLRVFLMLAVHCLSTLQISDTICNCQEKGVQTTIKGNPSFVKYFWELFDYCWQEMDLVRCTPGVQARQVPRTDWLSQFKKFLAVWKCMRSLNNWFLLFSSCCCSRSCSILT